MGGGNMVLVPYCPCIIAPRRLAPLVQGQTKQKIPLPVLLLLPCDACYLDGHLFMLSRRSIADSSCTIIDGYKEMESFWEQCAITVSICCVINEIYLLVYELVIFVPIFFVTAEPCTLEILNIISLNACSSGNLSVYMCGIFSLATYHSWE